MIISCGEYVSGILKKTALNVFSYIFYFYSSPFGLKYIKPNLLILTDIANMLVLTHTDCKERIYIERLTEIFKNELGYEASDIHLIKCLVDFQVTRDTNIPTAERAHALGVLYAITHDGVEKKKMMESRHKYRQT